MRRGEKERRRKDEKKTGTRECQIPLTPVDGSVRINGMKPSSTNWPQGKIAVVIPCYRVEKEIEAVLASIPDYVTQIIVVDDASPDTTAQKVEAIMRTDARVILLRHKKNAGVGGAMVTGYKKALEQGAEIIVKIDGDGQMSTEYLPQLLAPLLRCAADYAKGNRFRDLRTLQQMPWLRRIGNIGLSFLSKAATGYWNLFDPTNGYTAIRAEALQMLALDEIDHSFFFETSMLAQLYLIGAVVVDTPIPARYGDEISNLSVRRVLWQFPPKLGVTLLRRLALKTFIYDFSMQAIYLLAGLPLLAFGLFFGIAKWVEYASNNVLAPTGTVMLATLTFLLGTQFLIAAIEIDLRSIPQEPICKR